MVWVGDAEALAAIVAGGLEAEGFTTQVVGNRAAHAARGVLNPFGSWAVLVPVASAVRARKALEESGDGANVVERDQAGTPGGNLRIIARLTLYALPVLIVFVLVILIRNGL